MTSPQARRLCLVGVRGVGKSTLARAVIPKVPTFDYIVGSAVLRELVGPEFARFDHLPAERKVSYRLAAIDWMERRQTITGLHVLCDGHTALLDESSGEVGIVFTDRDCEYFRELVLMEAPPDTILERRRADATKRRSLDPSTIEREIAAERTAVAAISARWGQRIHHLQDGAGAADQLQEILR